MHHKIHIGKTTTVGALQEGFNKLYRFLKVEFFTEPHLPGKGTSKNKMVSKDLFLYNIQKIKRDGYVIIDANSSVYDIESRFEKDFGLYVQIFRKSGNVWLETSATDSWTLQQQNDEGAFLARHFKTEPENIDDHDVY